MNFTGCLLDDAVREVWRDMEKSKTNYKGVCMQLQSNGEKVVREEEKDIMKEEEEGIPDLNDYEARYSYEKKLFLDTIKPIISETTVRYLAWWFYYRTTNNVCKFKLGLIGWISDLSPAGKTKMAGPSAFTMLKGTLKLQGASILFNDASDVDYDEICQNISGNYKN